jgi:hypothetical protein
MRSYLFTEDYATLVFDDGEWATIYNDNPRFSTLTQAIVDSNWDLARKICFPAEEVSAALVEVADQSLSDLVSIRSGVVYYRGTYCDERPIHNALTARIVQQLERGYVLRNLIRFFERLMQNPSCRAVNELYSFIEASSLPITEDGHFLAYKRIRSDWTDCHSGQVVNKPATLMGNEELSKFPVTVNNVTTSVLHRVDGPVTHVSMPRNMVDEDKNRHCSSGLHFCSRGYLSEFGTNEGGRVIVVKIDPSQVVSIPSDHQNQKGRCCRYEVLYELPLQDVSHTALPTTSLEGLVATVDGRKLPNTSQPADRAEYILEVMPIRPPGETSNPLYWESVDDARLDLGIERSAILRVLRGDRKSTGGYTFRWVPRFEEFNPRWCGYSGPVSWSGEREYNFDDDDGEW